jgi:hypothetical protein
LHEATPQVPVVQVPVALAGAHCAPHEPQFAFVLSEVSQPFEALPSQLPQPLVHAGTHAPLVHAVVPLAFVQATPQAPQFSVEFSAVSQPSVTSPLQLPQPVLHEIEHTPSAQLAVPLALPQTVPHVPQLVVLVCVLVSQPLLGLPSQLPNPAAHTGAQVPETHEVVPLALVQALLHAPQLLVVLSAASQPLDASPSQLP